MTLFYILGGIVLLLLLAVLSGHLITRHLFAAVFLRNDNLQLTADSLEKQLKNSPYADWLPQLREGQRLLREGPFEPLYIPSRDHLQLYGRLYLCNTPTNTTIIVSHGYRSCAEHDFGGAFPFYRQQSCHILVIDQRAHGNSEGNYICFGAKEQYDLLCWMEYLVNRFGPEHRLVLAGISMGATTSLLAATAPTTPPQLRGVIADCGYVSPEQEFRHVLRTRIHLPAFPLLGMAERLCRRRAGFGFDDFSTAERLKTCQVPVLLIHGEADTFVPPKSTHQNYDACASPKTLLLVPQAEHGMSFLKDEPRYRQTVEDFLKSL